jgi:hypothetical protein
VTGEQVSVTLLIISHGYEESASVRGTNTV